MKSVLWVSLLLASTAQSALAAQDIRVELFSRSGLQELTLHATGGPLRLCNQPHAQRCLVLAPAESARCTEAPDGVRCTTQSRAWRFARVSAVSPSPFRLEWVLPEARHDQRTGATMVRAAELRPQNEALQLIVTVDLETYVAGVLAGEAATMKSPAALAAMAVLARTWALRSRGRHRARRFDFCSLTHCEFFRPPPPSDTGPSPFGEAAGKTEGLVLKYGDHLIESYYSAHCGGVTEDAGAVWPDRTRPYLRSVRDPYCARSEQARWQQVISLADLTRVLNRMPGRVFAGSLRDLMVLSRDESGRARTVQLVGRSVRRIDANQFRFAVNRELGWNTLKSSLYTVQRRVDVLVFSGRGLGHGIGLCQAGAEQMGQMGVAYERILAHYFPGTRVEQAEEGRAERILASEHFEIVFPSDQEALATKALESLEEQRRKLGARANALPARIRVRTWGTTAAFIRVTGQPGWAAASNDGRVIDLQPLRTLQAKGILGSTLRHELTHLMVRRLRAPAVPRWYEEGLVLYLTGERVSGTSAALDRRQSLELSISHSGSESEMRAAYARALDRVREVARQRGEAGLWQVLERPSAEDHQWFKDGQ